MTSAARLDRVGDSQCTSASMSWTQLSKPGLRFFHRGRGRPPAARHRQRICCCNTVENHPGGGRECPKPGRGRRHLNQLSERYQQATPGPDSSRERAPRQPERLPLVSLPQMYATGTRTRSLVSTSSTSSSTGIWRHAHLVLAELELIGATSALPQSPIGVTSRPIGPTTGVADRGSRDRGHPGRTDLPANRWRVHRVPEARARPGRKSGSCLVPGPRLAPSWPGSGRCPRRHSRPKGEGRVANRALIAPAPWQRNQPTDLFDRVSSDGLGQ